MSSTNLFLANRLDYLQRIGKVPPVLQLTAQTPLTGCLPQGGTLVRITGIGRHEKSAVAAEKTDGVGAKEHLLSEDLLTGFYGQQVPLLFFVRGDLDQVALYLGTWMPEEQNPPPAPLLSAAMQEHQDVLLATLRGLYPAIYLDPLPFPFQITQPLWSGMEPADLSTGLVLGVPTIKPGDPSDKILPLDRLIRALAGSRWSMMILAVPVGEGVISRFRNQVINESQVITAASSSLEQNRTDPLTQAYMRLLDVMLTSFTQGQALGMWRTATYLLGDRSGYQRLASLWRSTFSGDRSLPDPIHVWRQPEATIAELTRRWAMPDEWAPRQEGGYIHHAFQYQTLLTSSQLAAYIHLPQRETHGFAVTIVPDFDVIPPSVSAGPAFSLGTVVHHTRKTTIPYRVSVQSLTRHTFISGITGAGKTNTIFHLLKQSAVPFLILEPAKTEYRMLLHDQRDADRLRIFTLGDETTSPLRFNPFEVLPGTAVSTHLDLLRSVFVASFGLWAPLPQLLEQCLHRIYTDRGWDLLTNTNQRLGDASPVAFPEVFPTMSDLVAAVSDVLNQLDYEKEVKGNMQTALLVRLQALCIGGKGAMLDVQRSLPMEMILEQPTILELEAMGDDDDRALMMGLILIRLYEYRRAHGQVKDLQHLLIIEEAHRLLANVGERRREEEANPRGKAVETFANLLSEIRAFGQGVIIADQVPTKLAPDVIKNTNLKIVHRIVAQDDRHVLAGAMAMDEKQAMAFATLSTGNAVVFSEGDDVPVLIEVPPAKGSERQAPPDNRQIAARMGALKQRLSSHFHRFPTCQGHCSSLPGICQAAQQMVAQAAFQRAFTRVVLSMLEEVEALDRMWDDILLAVHAHRPVRNDEQEFMPCLFMGASRWFAERRGQQSGWSYAETREMTTVLYQVLLAKHTRANPDPARAAFQQSVRKLYARHYDPYPFCHQICQQDPPMCFYRSSVADLIASGRMHTTWSTAYDQDIKQLPDEPKERLWVACQDAGYTLIEFSEDAVIGAVQRRVCLCYAQQMLITDAEKVLPTARRVLRQLIKEANNGTT